MTEKSLLRHFAVGLIIGLLIFPPLPAQAQFGGIVFDPKNYALQVKKHIDDASRWIATVDQHTRVYFTLVQQLTTLHGVLRTVDKQLFKNRQLALLANDIGKIINDSDKLRRRLDGMIRYEVKTLKSIDDRLEQGIFDPDADLRDIQNYLLYTMGRDARQTVDYTRRLVRADNQLATWWDEKRKLEKDVSTISDALKANRALLKKENELPPEDPRDIQHLNDAILEQEKQIADLQARIKDLTEKINQRVKDYGLRLEDMENFAHQIDATNEMWRELQKTKGEMQQTLDGLITGDVAPAPPQ